MKLEPTRFYSWAAVCVFCFFQFAANIYSSVLTFDEMPPVDFRVIENGYGGLQWNNFFIQNATNSAGFLPGMVSSPDVAFNVGQPSSISSSPAFINLESAYLTGAYGLGSQIRVRGYADNILLYENTYVVNGSGPTLVTFNYQTVDRVTFETLPSGRTFAMDNLSFTVTNRICTYALSTNYNQHGPNSASGSVSVSTYAGCGWSVSNTNAWVTITSGLDNTNSGNVTYTVSSNLTASPRTGFIAIAGHGFSVRQFAVGGTNLIDFGVVQSPTVGHNFDLPPPFLPEPIFVVDALIDQDQSSGGGVFPSVSANFDTHNRFVLTVSAPSEYRFLVKPPPGQPVRFSGSLTWTRGDSSTFRYGTLAVGFGGLEGIAPDFSASRTVLTDSHGFFGFNDIQSTPFTNDLAFSSITLTATVPSMNLGLGTLNYDPYGNSGSLVLYYTTSETNDPGPFVFIVPAQPTVNLTVQPNGDLTITFTGTLQWAGDANGFTDVPSNPQGTYTIPKASLSAWQFFRARD